MESVLKGLQEQAWETLLLPFYAIWLQVMGVFYSALGSLPYFKCFPFKSTIGSLEVIKSVCSKFWCKPNIVINQYCNQVHFHWELSGILHIRIVAGCWI